MYEQEYPGRRRDTRRASRVEVGDETYDDLLSRLFAERQKIVAEGAGLWAGSDAADAVRAARKRSEESIGQ